MRESGRASPTYWQPGVASLALAARLALRPLQHADYSHTYISPALFARIPTEIEGRKEISWPFAVGECATNEAQREKKQIYTAVGRGHGSGTFGEASFGNVVRTKSGARRARGGGAAERRPPRPYERAKVGGQRFSCATAAG
ncbi:unnamed protein product, partial [Iphiclides podalirius]